MINYNQTNIQKSGFYETEKSNYTVNVSISNSELTRLHVEVMDKLNSSLIGHISLENGRRIIETGNDVDVIEHLIVFGDILKSILSPSEEAEAEGV